MNRFNGQVLLLSPHIDDVPFSLGAALLDRRFSAAEVVNVFSISRSANNDDDVERVTTARRNEDEQFFRTIRSSVTRHYLDRLDAPLRLSITDDDVYRVTPSMRASAEVTYIRSALDVIRPERTALLVAPLALGTHVDHVVTHHAACDAARDGWQVAFYEDLPYASDVTLQGIQDAAEKTAAEVGVHLAPLVLHWSGAGSSKLKAIACYASQMGPTTLSRVHEHATRLGFAERLWCDARAITKSASGQPITS